jgi:hypothetical protein
LEIDDDTDDVVSLFDDEVPHRPEYCLMPAAVVAAIRPEDSRSA